MDFRLPTSVVLHRLLDEAPADHVTLAWLLGALQERSFGFLLLLLGLLGLVPALATIAAVLLLWPAVQMIGARQSPSLPGWLAQRSLSTRRLAGLIARLVPILRRLEMLVRPRWQTPSGTTKRVIGAIMLLLAMSMLAPVPLGHVPPAVVVMLLAFAYLEDDGLLLWLALIAATAVLAAMVVVVWGTVIAIDALD
ncbi:MAG TPA: exopolysaccharide biosynthesis protein [Vineibacter sp.]|nr:exopolysaccharide biosynthesis protein [Vineibacter sp.]